MVVELWHSVSQKQVIVSALITIYSQCMSMLQDTRSGHLQRIPLTGRPMDDTPITDTTTDYQDTGWHTSHSAIDLLCNWFFHASTLTPQGIGSSMVTTALQQSWSFRWQGNPLSSENQGPVLDRWYTRCIPIRTTGLGPRAWQGLGTFMMTSEIWHWSQSEINPC